MALPQTAKQFQSNGFWWNRRRPHWSHKLVSSYIVAGLVIFIDQLTKSFFSGFVVNYGVSFGLFSSWISWTDVWVVVPLMILICAWFVLNKYPIVRGLFLGGAMSNIMDRLVIGGVRDWLPVPVLGLRNNLADWAIVGALIIFLIGEVRKDRSMV